jgi:hypothetical protein
LKQIIKIFHHSKRSDQNKEVKMSIKIQETQQINNIQQLKIDKVASTPTFHQESDDLSLSNKAKQVQKSGVVPKYQINQLKPPTQEQLSSLEKQAHDPVQEMKFRANLESLPLVKNETPEPKPAATPQETIRQMEELKQDTLSQPNLSINQYMALMRANQIVANAKESLAHEAMPKADPKTDKKD